MEKRVGSNPILKGQSGRVSHTILLAVVWAGFGMAFFFYVSRVLIRLKINSKLNLDDIVVTLAISILLAHAIVITVMAGPMYDILAVAASNGAFVPPANFMERSTFYLRCQFAATCLFWSCVWAVKASFLVFYKTLIDGLKYLPTIWWIIVGITSMSYVASIISYPVSCTSFTLGMPPPPPSALPPPPPAC
jgi:hypothetical protein